MEQGQTDDAHRVLQGDGEAAENLLFKERERGGGALNDRGTHSGADDADATCHGVLQLDMAEQLSL